MWRLREKERKRKGEEGRKGEERGQVESKRLKAERKGCGKCKKKKTVMQGEPERQQWENKDNACVCVVFVAVAFSRTEGLYAWMFACVCVRVSLHVCVPLRFPIHSICGIDPLPNSEQNKKSA